MDAFTTIQLLSGVRHPNEQMIEFGIVAGVAAAVAYSVSAVRFLFAST